MLHRLSCFAALAVIAGCDPHHHHEETSRASLDAMFDGRRTTVAIEELAPRVALAPGEGFKIVELGRDASTSHHLVALREREPLHRHDRHDLIVYNLKGEGTMLIGAEERAIGPGSIVYVPRATVHSMHNHSPEPLLGYAVFTPPFDGADRVPADAPLPASP